MSPDTYVIKGDPIVVNVLAEPTGEPAISMTGVMSFPNNASVPKTMLYFRLNQKY